MSLSNLLLILKGGAGSGNKGHAGIPGKVGGSKPKWSGSMDNLINIKGSKHVEDGVYKSVYFSYSSADTAKKKAEALGPNYKAIIYKKFYHVIDTTSKQGQQAATEIEKMYNSQNKEKQEFARKYGLLPTDNTSEKYLKEIEHKLPMVSMGVKTPPKVMQFRAVQEASLQHSDDKSKMEEALKFGNCFNKDTGEYVKVSGSTHKIMEMDNNLSSTGKSYFLVQSTFKKPTQAVVSQTPTFETDFSKMSALQTLPASKLADINKSIKDTWNSNDHSAFKAEAKNAFKVTLPDKVIKDYEAVKSSIDNEKYSMYHGTDHTGASHISRDGYRVNPTPKIGRIHGNGLYLADQHSKSIQYAHDGSGSSATHARGVLFYNKSSLGNVVTTKDSFGSTDYGNNLNPGIDTLRIKPDLNSWRDSREYVVKNERGVLPTVWVDIERRPS